MSHLTELREQLNEGFFIPTFENIDLAIQLLAELHGETESKSGSSDDTPEPPAQTKTQAHEQAS